MILELVLIRKLIKYEQYTKYCEYIDKEALKQSYKELYNIVMVLTEYFNKYPKDLTIDELELYFYSSRPMLKDKDKEVYSNLFNQIRGIVVDDSLIEEILLSMKQRQQAFALSEQAYLVSQGKAKYGDLMESVSTLDKPEILDTKDQFVTSDLGELYERAVKSVGLRWRLNTLNRMLGSLRKGDFGFIFARPESGKTTFLASEISQFAQQTIHPILWFNNEEQGSKVMLRIYQATLGLTLTELFSDLNKHKRDYYDRTGDRIKLYDQGNISRSDVERLAKQLQPSCIVFDQIDKIRGFVNDREDLRLGAIYVWARQLAKDYCPVIGVCQASGAGEGKKWLTMSDVSNAITSKQAEADFIIGIGKSHDEGLEFVRHINISKNKLFGDSDTEPTLRHGKMDILIQPEIARYKDI